MTTRGAAVQGSLAALGLIAAYTTWQREPERPAGEVVVLDVSKSDLTKVRYEDGAKWVELEPRKDDGEPSVWMRVSARPDAKAPEREVRGNEGAQRLLDRLAPLRAARGLGALPGDKLKELGLEAPKKKLTLSARGTSYVFEVGSPPSGVSDPYVKDVRDGKVYVLGQMLVSDLDGAALRLVDRTLHRFKQPDFDNLTVTAGGKRRELSQQGGDNPLTLKLVAKASGKPDDTAKNWHDKLFRLSGIDALGKGELPAGATPQVGLRIDYTQRGSPRGWIELARVAPAAVATASSAPPSPPEIYARSEHSAGWVRLPSTAEELMKEGEKIAASE